MKYFFDTKFIEGEGAIDLISIGVVSEDDREYYAVNAGCQFQNASEWVWENVLYPMGIYSPLRCVNPSDCSTSALTKETLLKARNRARIKEDLLLFFAGGIVDSDKDQSLDWDKAIEGLEIWSYYADYNWIVLSQLFGTMMNLPKGFPAYCRAIRQWHDQLGGPELSNSGRSEHNALECARWNRRSWEFLKSIS